MRSQSHSPFVAKLGLKLPEAPGSAVTTTSLTAPAITGGADHPLGASRMGFGFWRASQVALRFGRCFTS